MDGRPEAKMEKALHEGGRLFADPTLKPPPGPLQILDPAKLMTDPHVPISYKMDHRVLNPEAGSGGLSEQTKHEVEEALHMANKIKKQQKLLELLEESTASHRHLPPKVEIFSPRAAQHTNEELELGSDDAGPSTQDDEDDSPGPSTSLGHRTSAAQRWDEIMALVEAAEAESSQMNQDHD